MHPVLLHLSFVPPQVVPRRLRRSRSWSALHNVVSHKSQVSLGTAQTLMVKVRDTCFAKQSR
jgi:hypothetical protein